MDQELNPENDPGANPAQVGQLLSLRFHLGSTGNCSQYYRNDMKVSLKGFYIAPYQIESPKSCNESLAGLTCNSNFIPKEGANLFQYYAHSEQYVTSRYPSQESIDVLEAGRLQVQLTEGKKSHLLMQKTDIYSIASFTANKRSTFQCFKTDSCVVLHKLMSASLYLHFKHVYIYLHTSQG